MVPSAIQHAIWCGIVVAGIFPMLALDHGSAMVGALGPMARSPRSGRTPLVNREGQYSSGVRSEWPGRTGPPPVVGKVSLRRFR